MSVTSSRDVSAAAWIDSTDLSWERLVCLGPDGFERYARLRFIPDPERPDQHEEDVPTAGDPARRSSSCARPRTSHSPHQHAPVLLLRAVGRLGVFPADGPAKPAWVVPDRDFFLFHGPLDALGDEAQWRPVLRSSGQEWWLPTPAFVWPEDRAWCLTRDVDPYYAGIAAAPAAIEDLLAHPHLDVVPADPTQVPPHYS